LSNLRKASESANNARGNKRKIDKLAAEKID